MKLGNLDIVDCKIGSTQINKVYLGSNLVWQKASPFIFEVSVSDGETIDPTLFVNSGFASFDVDWGDGTIETFGGFAKRYHTYESAGNYQVKCYEGLGAAIFSSDLWITKIKQWGTIQWKSYFVEFFNCTNLEADYTDTPDLSLFTGSFRNMFNRCTLWNGYMNDWDTSGVKSMDSTFFRASSFNQPLDNWDVSSVTTMSNMLAEAYQWSDANYGDALIAWASLPTPPSEISFHAGDAKYPSSAASARDTLINTYNWTITDGGAA